MSDQAAGSVTPSNPHLAEFYKQRDVSMLATLQGLAAQVSFAPPHERAICLVMFDLLMGMSNKLVSSMAPPEPAREPANE